MFSDMSLLQMTIIYLETLVYTRNFMVNKKNQRYGIFLSLGQHKYMNSPIGFEIVLCCVLLGKKQFVIQNLARLHKLTKGPQMKGAKSINLIFFLH